MAEHPIQSLFTTTLDSIKSMIDVNTVVGDPLETADGLVMIPISRVTFGFAVGGSNLDVGGGDGNQGKKDEAGFGGGTGAAVTVQPVAFLIVDDETVHLLPVDEDNPYLKLLQMIPEVAEEIRGLFASEDDFPPAKA
ncbi:MAG: GerW family sporulation protein [Bacillota bacterium]